MRTFIAIELEPRVKQSAADFIRTASRRCRDAKWVSADQLHITLKFLGDIREDDPPRVLDLIRAAAGEIAPFEITVGGLGAFPSRTNARILWLGVRDAAAACAKWVAAADPLFADFGVPPEERAFTPHLTLARAKTSQASEELRRLLEREAGPPPLAMTVSEIALYESVLDPRGARYSVIGRVPLSA